MGTQEAFHSVRRLLEDTARPPDPEVLDAIVAHDEDAVPHLVRLYHDPTWASTRVPLVVLALLGEIAHPDGVPTLLAGLLDEDGDADGYAHDALVRCGPVATDPLLAHLRTDPELYGPVLAEGAEVGDPRVRRALRWMLEQHPQLGADCVRLFDDNALVPDLVRTLRTLADGCRTGATGSRQEGLDAVLQALDHFDVACDPATARQVQHAFHHGARTSV